MKTKVKELVLKFMTSTDTSDMNSNQFVADFINIHKWDDPFYIAFLKAPSVESITRSRRYLTKAYWIWKRTNSDTEQEYIESYALSNKIHTWLNT